MRRALHSFIIALLCLTLGIDSAKACWFWRHRCRPAVARHAVCPPASTCGIPCAEACTVLVAEVREEVSGKRGQAGGHSH